MGLLSERRRYIVKKEPIECDIIYIDQSTSVPNLMISGDINGTIIKQIRNSSHIYLGKYTDDNEMTICQLSDESTNLYYNEDVANLDGTEGDVFMKLPPFSTKVVEISPSKFKISFALGHEFSDRWIKWGGDDLIGVYLATSKNNRLYSISSGALPTVSVSNTGFKDSARNRGNGYTLVKHKHANIMAFLFYAMYGTTDAISILGGGYGRISPGSTNSLGMKDSKSGRVRFWGLEDWISGIIESEDNVQIDSNTKIWEVTEDDGTIRTLQAGPKTKNYITKIQIGQYLDTNPISIDGGVQNNGFCSYYYTDTVVPIEVNGRGGLNKGLITCYANGDPTIGYTDVGTRLCFRGKLIEEPNIEIFKAIPITN